MLQLEFNFFVFAFPIAKHYYCLVVSVTPIDSIDWLLILLWLCFRLKDSPTFDSYQHKPLDKIFEPFLFDVFATDERFIQTNTVVLIASDIYKLPWKQRERILPWYRVRQMLWVLYTSVESKSKIILFMAQIIFMATSTDHLKSVFNWPRREMFVSKSWQTWVSLNVITSNNAQ